MFHFSKYKDLFSFHIDQALEKEYNKNAQGGSGIIGFTRKKEVIAKWNTEKMQKHEKIKKEKEKKRKEKKISVFQIP